MKQQKRTCLSGIEKNEILEFRRNNLSLTYAEIADHFSKSFKVSLTDRYVGDIIRQSNISNATYIESEQKKNRTPKFEKIEQCLRIWIDQENLKGLPITEDIIKMKAEFFAGAVGEQDFKASNGWLYRFKSRHGIKSWTLSGESDSYDKNIVENGRKELMETLQQYSPSDIYNMDETALYVKGLPAKSIHFKSRKGRHQSKARVTIALCSNSDGSDKRKPIVIGISKYPRCFKGTNVQNYVQYTNSKKGWMNSIIFNEWVKEFNNEMRNKGREIILLVDNASSHKYTPLSNIKIHFLPKNTTGILQPMDAGIIKTFKAYYKRLFLRQVVHFMDESNNLEESLSKIPLIISIQMIRSAWNQVTAETINNCFFHTGIMSRQMEFNDELLAPILDDIRQFIASLKLNEAMTISEYMDIEQNENIEEALNEAEIAVLVCNSTQDCENTQTTDSEEETQQDDFTTATHICPTNSEVLTSLETLRRYFILTDRKDMEELSYQYMTFEETCVSLLQKKVKQTSIKDFFQ